MDRISTEDNETPCEWITLAAFGGATQHLCLILNGGIFRWYLEGLLSFSELKIQCVEVQCKYFPCEWTSPLESRCSLWNQQEALKERRAPNSFSYVWFFWSRALKCRDCWGKQVLQEFWLRIWTPWHGPVTVCLQFPQKQSPKNHNMSVCSKC